MTLRALSLVLAILLVGACSGKNDNFIARGIGKGDKDADRIMEPNAMANGPGLVTGKSGEYEIISREDESDEDDPNKPRRVKRRRR